MFGSLGQAKNESVSQPEKKKFRIFKMNHSYGGFT